jgi:hypothetical protein
MRHQNAKDCIALIAQRQWGRLSWAQLRAVGLDKKTVWRWERDGYLHGVLPCVYAVGHCAPSVEADLAAALLYAGPGAVLTHATGAWWWELIDEQPRTLELSTPRRCMSLTGIHVHERRALERTWHKGLPVTQPAQTLLDYAATCPFRRLRRAIAEADYRHLATPRDLQAVLAPGRAGSTKLRQALGFHQPRLAHTRSALEVVFFELCERHELPLPLVNVRLEGFLVDAFWPAKRLVVEVDGGQAHGTPARVARDRANELALRGAGYRVIRYSWWQVTEQPELVATDLRSALERWI